MACEKKEVHDAASVVCTVPTGCKEKEQSIENNQIQFKVLGAITIVAIVAAAVVGVTYFMSHTSSSEGGMLNKSKEDHTSGGNRKEVLVQFYYEGKLQNEMITKDRDQNLVTIVDEKTGFIVLQDYDSGIAMIKNTTSSDCFFTYLGYIQSIDMTMLTPIIVEEVVNGTSPSGSNDDITVTLIRSDVIPSEYVQVSNRPEISRQCVVSTSYWLKGSPSFRVRRRGPVPVAPATIPPPDLPTWWDQVTVVNIEC